MKKRLTCDKLTLSQWRAGRLFNIYHVNDHTLTRQALMQVIHSMRDAVSLLWMAMSNSYATSMHKIEEDTLQWDNSTQWALNLLRASQVTMNSQAITHYNPTGQPLRRPCHYYNEGNCSHDTHHGHYRHVCSICSKSGRAINTWKVNVTSSRDRIDPDSDNQEKLLLTLRAGGRFAK